MRTRIRVLPAVAAVALLVGCSTSAPDPTTSASGGGSVLAEHGLTGLDGRQIVDQLDRVPVAERDAGLVASVRAGEVLVSEAGSDDPVSVPLPGDEFYLSVAPYVDTTHDCFYHSLTTCHGELGGQDVHVTITDTAGGDVLVDEDTTTFDNGFVGYWLPAGIEATLTIEHNGLAVTAPVSTGPQDATCLTALQLT